MRKILSIFNFKKLPWAFIICFILFLSVEIVTRCNVGSLRTLSDALFAYKGQQIKKKSVNTWNGLFFGDSRLIGLNAKNVSEYVSRATDRQYELYNYTFPNHGIRSYYLLLKKYLKYNTTPEFIVISSAPMALTKEWNINRKPHPEWYHRFSSLYTLQEAFEVLSFTNFLKLSLIKIERLSTFITYRGKIKAVIKDPSLFQNMEGIIEKSAKSPNSVLFIARDVLPTDLEVKNSIYFKNKFIVDKEALFWFYKFFAFAEERNIEVFILNVPLIRQVHEQRVINGSNDVYELEMQKIVSKFHNTKIMEPLTQPYDILYFADTHHLNKKGWKKFNQEVNQRLEVILREKD